MSWLYVQATGELYSLAGTGYAGKGAGKNNPALQRERSVGPLPAGYYDIGPPRDGGAHGPLVRPLTPDPANAMFGRSAFLIHGDSLTRPGDASEGCIIMPRSVRAAIPDHARLYVIARLP
jgi:hypothetical protein